MVTMIILIFCYYYYCDYSSKGIEVLLEALGKLEVQGPVVLRLLFPLAASLGRTTIRSTHAGSLLPDWLCKT